MALVVLAVVCGAMAGTADSSRQAFVAGLSFPASPLPAPAFWSKDHIFSLYSIPSGRRIQV